MSFELIWIKTWANMNMFFRIYKKNINHYSHMRGGNSTAHDQQRPKQRHAQSIEFHRKVSNHPVCVSLLFCFVFFDRIWILK